MSKNKHILKLLLISLLSSSFILSGCHRQEKDAMISSEISIDDNNEEIDEIEKPDIKSKYEEAAKNNPDVVAWINIPNTTIDYAVLQNLSHPNDPFYYTHRDMNGNKVAVGRESAIMSDADNITTPFKNLSPNLVISGHNVNINDNPNGKMFSPLGYFKNIEFSKKTPYIFLKTKDKELIYQVYASFYSEEKFTYNFPNKTKREMKDMIAEAKERSNFIYPDVEVKDTDKVLTLYTCTYHFGKYRTRGYYRVKYVVQAKLLPDNAKLKKSANIKINPRPKKVEWNY